MVHGLLEAPFVAIGRHPCTPSAGVFTTTALPRQLPRQTPCGELSFIPLTGLSSRSLFQVRKPSGPAYACITSAFLQCRISTPAAAANTFAPANTLPNRLPWNGKSVDITPQIEYFPIFPCDNFASFAKSLSADGYCVATC